MKKLSLLGLATVLLVGFNSTSAFADNWGLGDWSANINGTTYNPPALPGSVSTPAGYPVTGGSALGSFTFTISNPGANYVGVYLNPYDDYGFGDDSTAFASVNGTLPAGVSYQLGWPGVDPVFDNFAANALDGTNTVGVPAPPLNVCCEVAMAELFNFTLNPGDTATVNFTLSQSLPSGFYIQVSDPNGSSSVYLTETSSIAPSGPAGPVVPEPASILLLASGASIVWAKRRMLRKKA